MGCCGSKGDVNADPDLVPLAAEPALRSGSGPAVSREWAEAALRRSGALAEDASLVAMAEAKMMVTNMEGNELEDGGGLSGPKIIKLRMTFSSNAPADAARKISPIFMAGAHARRAFVKRDGARAAAVRLRPGLRDVLRDQDD